MRVFFLIVFGILFVAVSLLTHETLQRDVKSSAPFIVIKGRFVYPENDIYTVMLTDSTICVNGVVYIRTPKPVVPLPKPDRNKDFFDWIIRYPADSARAIIEDGGTKEEAKRFIDDFYATFADSETLNVDFEKGFYRITYKGEETGFGLPRQKREPKVDYWENWLYPSYQTLCRDLERGSIIIKGDGYWEQIVAEEISQELIRELQTVHQRAVCDNPYEIYEGIELTGKSGKRIKLGPSAVEDFVKAHK